MGRGVWEREESLGCEDERRFNMGEMRTWAGWNAIWAARGLMNGGDKASGR